MKVWLAVVLHIYFSLGIDNCVPTSMWTNSEVAVLRGSSVMSKLG